MKKKYILFILIIVFLITGCSLVARLKKKALAKPHIVDVFQIKERVEPPYSGFQVIEDNIYVYYGKSLYCYSLLTNKQKWAISLSRFKNGTFEKIEKKNGLIFAFFYPGTNERGSIFLCLNEKNGEIIWQRNDIFVAPGGSMITEKNRIYVNLYGKVGEKTSYFGCLNQQNGKTIWRHKGSNIRDYSRPLNKFYIFSDGIKGVMKINKNNGQELGFIKRNKHNLWLAQGVKELIVDNNLYFFDNIGKSSILYSYDIKNLKKKWQFQVKDGYQENESECSFGKLYCTEKFLFIDQSIYNDSLLKEKETIYCFDKKNGKLVWEKRPNYQIIAVDNNYVIATAYKLPLSLLSRYIEWLDLNTGNTIWKQNIRITDVPSMDESQLYFAKGKTVYKIQLD